MSSEPEPNNRIVTAWRNKFAWAIGGALWAFRTQNSFWVHIPITIIVFSLAAFLKVAAWQWTAIVIATMVVFAAELLNTAIEQLVKVVHPEHDPRVGRALDAAAAAVLVTAIGAVAVGLLTLGPPLLQFLLPALWPQAAG
ncbi:diacylglycerol kinase [Planctomycetes bacterium K23_9]|uniref:Undecaprenol kinase n=1 Tax=Stieleria marina TaxID=1930275 RepID=A0A517P1L0_9BACT|nr:Undecaprenol kinase [Planctomycetes bacterium K23_9]